MVTWKEIGRTIGIVLLLGVVAFNLFHQNGIFISIFRGVVVYLVYSILNILISNIILKQLNEFEIHRLEAMQEEDDEDEDDEDEDEVSSRRFEGGEAIE